MAEETPYPTPPEDGFDGPVDAINFAHEHMSATPVDELSTTAVQRELEMLNQICEWDEAATEPGISERRTALQAALEYDHFDSLAHSRQGNQYISRGGNTVILDAIFSPNDAIITHYHYLVIDQESGTVSHGDGATNTTPSTDDSQWIRVEELEEFRETGTLRPARPYPTDTPTNAETLNSLAEILRPYFDHGCSPTQAIDHLMCDGGRAGERNAGPFTQAEWAQIRGVSGQQVVAANVQQARDTLPD